MKVKDLLPMNIDIDVYDDVCDDLSIAFCGPLKLTDAGAQKFAEVLEYDVELTGIAPVAIVHVDDPDDEVWEAKLAKAAEFFESAAGWCTVDDYKTWFVEEE